ncbi:hypothetical protein Smp_181070 [Schistosoma mansoni]|uniref:hypothetical protein n=1 Tax=Schistosoma mansoni TaxID=6183 RepID=UPI0001A62DA1|nr:hypothetical protein Smp_181070 [Schistosoma mansoni]|eukprot:XP_018650088.1 hypothetical protein Smp_181070 [Schistosoma mansoni]
MFHIHCIGLTLLTVILWQSNGIHAKPSLEIDANDIQCDICMGVVSLGKLFLVSPIMDSIKKMLVEKLCTLPGIMRRRCMHWGYDQIDEMVVHFLKQKSSKPCKYFLLCSTNRNEFQCNHFH